MDIPVQIHPGLKPWEEPDVARSRDTDVLHRGEGAPDGATPLGRPIYTSSTFVFANAAEVKAEENPPDWCPSPHGSLIFRFGRPFFSSFSTRR